MVLLALDGDRLGVAIDVSCESNNHSFMWLMSEERTVFLGLEIGAQVQEEGKKLWIILKKERRGICICPIIR